jgi:hypothetical protein
LKFFADIGVGAIVNRADISLDQRTGQMEFVDAIAGHERLQIELFCQLHLLRFQNGSLFQYALAT